MKGRSCHWSILVGVGGWDYDPWRGTFYPPGLAKAKQLEYASRQLSATEINATYYKLQSPALFERWAKSVPDGFKFADALGHADERITRKHYAHLAPSYVRDAVRKGLGSLGIVKAVGGLRLVQG